MTIQILFTLQSITRALINSYMHKTDVNTCRKIIIKRSKRYLLHWPNELNKLWFNERPFGFRQEHFEQIKFPLYIIKGCFGQRRFRL